MRKALVSSLMLLALAALAALAAVPGFAADLDPVTETEVDLSVEELLLPVEEPLMTPVEDSEIPQLLDLGPAWEEKIRECDEWEAEQYCGPGCDCVITAVNVYCFC